MSEQKFHKGDLVRIAKDLGSSMSHFTSDCDAIVEYSYHDRYGGGNTDSYSLILKGRGSSAWYYENQLTLIEANRGDLLTQWEKEKADAERQQSDLDWIFKNGDAVLQRGYGASVQALANCFGLTNLWGSHGEGYVWMRNAAMTMRLAGPFLESGDKEGYLAKCKLIYDESAQPAAKP